MAFEGSEFQSGFGICVVEVWVLWSQLAAINCPKPKTLNSNSQPLNTELYKTLP